MKAINPLTHLDAYYVILGSQSPRRKELLTNLGLSYKTLVSDAEEVIPDDMEVMEAPAYLSKLKSDDLMSQVRDNFLLITADTVVIHKNKILGKPKNSDDAINMISKLSDNTHAVVTGVTVRSAAKIKTFSNTTLVTVAPLSKKEITWYVENYNVMDKAGSYGIQDWLGVTKITKLKGSYYNVMGLPTDELFRVLQEW